MTPRMLDAVIIGNGPAGSGLLSCILKQSASRPDRPLKLCSIEACSTGKAGRLSGYNIPSDTRAEKFLTCLEGLPPSIQTDAHLAKLSQELRDYKSKAAPLPLVGEFYRQLGRLICDEMVLGGQLDVKTDTQALWAKRHRGHWELAIRSDGRDNIVKSKKLVLACGATESEERIMSFLKAYDLGPSDLDQVELSSSLLKAKANDAIFRHLRTLENPKVVIIGGSHSAISSAGKLLSQDINFGHNAISIFHRRPMQVTFDSPEDAVKHGVTDFDETDICPKTGRVFALKGFRLDSRDLFMAIKGYGGQPVEKRVELKPLENIPASDIKQDLLAADLVICALGYSPNYIPLYQADKAEAIALNAPHFVNQNSQLLDSQGRIIDACYALGLASNYNLAGRFGEPSFKGQANGLVLWYKEIGMELASSL